MCHHQVPLSSASDAANFNTNIVLLFFLAVTQDETSAKNERYKPILVLRLQQLGYNSWGSDDNSIGSKDVLPY
jgi:hypothetical protein